MKTFREFINELSDKTLSSYMKKSGKSLGKARDVVYKKSKAERQSGISFQDDDEKDAALNTIEKRNKGQELAKKKLSK